MGLPKSSGKQKKPRIVLRRVVGTSMSPRLTSGHIVIGSGYFGRIKPGQVYVFVHQDREKIKRVERVVANKVFFIGDNLGFSNDSRHFGWVDSSAVIAKIIWPRIHN